MTDGNPRSPDIDRLHALWQAQMSGHALVLLDADAIVVAAFGAVQETLGYAAHELIGSSLDRIFTPEDRALGLDRHELLTAAQAGDSVDDRWHLRQDGSRVWISGMLNALRETDGRLIGYAKLMRERTDLRVQTETLENRIAGLTEADHQKDVFIATLAHELRNPLMPLTSAVQLIRMAGGGERMRYPLQVIDRQLALLKRLVDDMMDVTRIDVGKLELRVEPLPLQAALSQAVELCRPAAKERGLAVHALLPPVPIVMEADPSRFEQIVVNLLNNAIKYTAPGGHIWIKATVEVDAAVIRVEDTGEGIATDMLPRIFDLFTQESRTASAASGGLGIGLALVKSLVAAHHGIVSVQSEGRGKGSVFTVRLPLRQPAQGALD